MPKPIPAGLARRLAEAADGYRDGQEYYLVFCYDEASDKDSMFTTLGLAQAYHEDELGRSDGYGIFGPYKTDVERDDQLSVDSISVGWNTNSDNQASVKFDSIYWTGSAVDKFLMPYYTHVWGVRNAKKLREDLLQYNWIGHPPGSYAVGRGEGLVSTPGTMLVGAKVDGSFDEIVMGPSGIFKIR